MFKLAAFADEAGALISEQIAALKDNGISYLEIRGVNGKNISVVSITEAREVRKQLDEACICVWAIGSPVGKIGLSDPFEPHLDAFKHMLELANILGAAHFRLFSFYGAEGKTADVLNRLSKFVDAAQGSGVVLCHENEKDIYGDTAVRCAELLRAIPSIKAVFDPANFIQVGQDVTEAWQLLAPYVEYLHIKDALADGTIVPAGHGIGHIQEILSDLNEQDVTLTIEPHLQVFKGFSELEREAKIEQKYAYPTQRAAFDAAVEALMKII